MMSSNFASKLWYFLLLIFILVLFISVNDCSWANKFKRDNNYPDAQQYQTDSYFDVLIFTQHFPITVCYSWQENSIKNQCSLPPVKDSWTIHGIWPTKFETIGPLYCNSSWPFNFDDLKSIENEMEKAWINVEKNTVETSFWKHEWEKHGTCTAQSIHQMDNEKKYFSQGLEWLKEYSITTLLYSSKIQPSSTDEYNLIDIHNALKEKLINSFGIVCYKDRHSQKQYLFEIRICFKKSLEITSCDGIVMLDGLGNDLGMTNEDEVLTNCHRLQTIIYPTAKNPPKPLLETADESKLWQRQLINFYKLVSLIKWITL